MSDRLKELQRQRSLVQEQLAWLDREIAAASGNTPTTPPVAAAPSRTPSSNSASSVAAEAIAAKYQSDAASLQGQVKRGCFMYFIIAFAAIGLGVLALYLYTTRK